jgi:hypothetical protein
LRASIISKARTHFGAGRRLAYRTRPPVEAPPARPEINMEPARRRRSLAGGVHDTTGRVASCRPCFLSLRRSACHVGPGRVRVCACAWPSRELRGRMQWEQFSSGRRGGTGGGAPHSRRPLIRFHNLTKILKQRARRRCPHDARRWRTHFSSARPYARVHRRPNIATRVRASGARAPRAAADDDDRHQRP